MTARNSYVEFVLGTLTALLKDCADMYPDCAREFERDGKRLSSAIEHHGANFVFSVMPAFRKHFDQCLSNGCLTHSGLIHFGSTRRGETVPRLFRGLTLRIFNRMGALRSDADQFAIKMLRQLLGAVRKLKVDCELKYHREAVQEFFSIENEVPMPEAFWTQDEAVCVDPPTNVSFTDFGSDGRSHSDLARFHQESVVSLSLLDTMQRVADMVSSELGDFSPLDWKVKHGPGAVSDSRFGTNKYLFPNWSLRLERCFPYAEFGNANYQCWADNVRLGKVPRDFDPPARLAAVPKTFTTPRLIAVECVSHQWCQQSIRDFFYSRVHKSRISPFISFRDQKLSGDLALKASIDASHATIDLSSASDRISCNLVGRLFRRSPGLLHAMRSSRAFWLEQDICRYSPKFSLLRKYSTMGNATTFPVQSILFLVAALACEFHTRQLKVCFENLKLLSREQVRVFGDDIITPSASSGLLVELLHHLGLKVNPAKTFRVGNFRESCGVDAFAGHDVTSNNVMDIPRRSRPGSIASSVDVHNNLIRSGYFATAHYIRQEVERQGCTRIPDVAHGAGAFGWWPNDVYPHPLRTVRTKWCEFTHQAYARVLTLTSKQRCAPSDDTVGLLQFFTEATKHITSAVSTLDYAVRRAQVGLSLRWVPLGRMR